jgi:hypothetical protein
MPLMPAHAVQGTLSSATVTRTLVTGSNTYGGCMAVLDQAINTATPTPNCPGNWVTFSCVGTYTSKDLGFHMLDQAQLALALNKSVLVTVDDTKKHNGYCFAFRIDVIK